MRKDQLFGSQIAKKGFQNEDDIVSKFNNWKKDTDAQKWLSIMEYNLEEIEYVKALKLSGSKTDVQVQVTIKLKEIIDAQNIQVKLVSNIRGFNQIDKRWVDTYASMWNMPKEIANILKLYTGETPHHLPNAKDHRRMMLNEFPKNVQNKVIKWFEKNKALIISDIIKGRGQLAAEWMLVAQKTKINSRWILTPINICLNHFGNGPVQISPLGNLKIGKVTVQRKGGDNGRITANMLQFKLNPAELFDLN